MSLRKVFFQREKEKALYQFHPVIFIIKKKSKEDEYIRAILLASIKLDGQEHVGVLRDTNARALERSFNRGFDRGVTREQAEEIKKIIDSYEDDPIGGVKAINEIVSKGLMSFGLLGLVNRDAQEEIITQSDGTEVKTASFVYDQERFNKFFEFMARGIFFHELGKRWTGNVNILSHTFLKDDAAQKDKDLSNQYLQHFDYSNAKGSQKEYFCYEGANEVNSNSGEVDSIFFNFCIFNTFYFTAIFPF